MIDIMGAGSGDGLGILILIVWGAGAFIYDTIKTMWYKYRD